ncbi:MAG: glycosyltransferase family 2 protein [Chloroflexaceae bacterium]|nr:glycosyltransferase family 2 protein [Chloroflexaceae bacterium]
MATVDILIPTYNRPAALAVLLTSLYFQTYRHFRVIISDQSQDVSPFTQGEVQAVLRLLAQFCPLLTLTNLPRQGIAQQRQFLLEQASAPYVLFLDDDLILEPYVLGNLLQTLQAEQCGFVGNAVIGMSFLQDVRPHEQHLEFWDGPVQPETVTPTTPAWQRWRSHNAANLYHIQQRLGISSERPRPYKVAWVSACVLYDRAKLLDCGGFSFWQRLPAAASGEDVLAQLRVMARYGGCGLLPSGAYHQELPTTLSDRSQDAHRLLPL